MGNICSRSKNESAAEPFARPGRVLGSSADNSAPRASVPANAKSKSHWQSPGRTLGGGGGGGENANPGAGTASGTGAVEDTDDARAKAALAAQKRAEATGPANKGKLGSKLAAQKAQTQNQTLNEVSRDERAARDADGASAARRWD
ncbi:hypothetical protein ASPVEDRAFT_146890 [Aspergillus versicolor CBS 583.65]|uniref:Uncharacterized protein n=1 Tax=Aspergillus versicolor CBS 583.65 TaxID=1036611 RepID=A0A1L9P7Q5_ASPVE|nr:uncharacterized protein ASPVEDRAFT_146890 [Aspergillus versicolor CBS 583.65]OJI97532.1 hypothetical protein ASPVEDRAFT_146890 [Aspergillus versicolor CBS 583.65]